MAPFFGIHMRLFAVSKCIGLKCNSAINGQDKYTEWYEDATLGLNSF